MDEEGELENLLIYMDFNTKIEDLFFSLEKEFKIIGLDSPEPILQLGNQVFQGEWMDTVGSYLFFEEVEENQHGGDPLFSETLDRTMHFCFKTDKLLHMSRIFLKPNVGNETDFAMKEDSLKQSDVILPES